MRQLSFILVFMLLMTPLYGQGHIPIRRAAAGDTPVDWTPSFVAVWLMEDSDDLGVNEAGTSCGADCDLTENGTPTQSTTAGQFKEGAASVDFGPDDDLDYMDCVVATCDELNATSGDDLTFGCWIKPDIDTQMRFIQRKKDGDELWALINNPTADGYMCGIGDGSDQVVVNSDADIAEGGDPISHVICQFDNTGDNLQLFYNGSTNGSPATQEDVTTDTTGSFNMSRPGTSDDVDGQMDECFYIKDLLTAAEICRICSCNIAGDNCTCNGTVYTDPGRNVADCGSCDAGDCNAAAP